MSGGDKFYKNHLLQGSSLIEYQRKAKKQE